MAVGAHRVLLAVSAGPISTRATGPPPSRTAYGPPPRRACRLAVLTNANGSLRADVEVGQPLLISDHLNLAFGWHPWRARASSTSTDAWSARLRTVARELDPTLGEGVYALLGGPHYETWAEAEWLRRIGADLVGMSTVYEAIAAREWGMELVGLSTVTAIEGTRECNAWHRPRRGGVGGRAHRHEDRAAVGPVDREKPH